MGAIKCPVCAGEGQVHRAYTNSWTNERVTLTALEYDCLSDYEKRHDYCDWDEIECPVCAGEGEIED